jgi:hypothetical protein
MAIRSGPVPNIAEHALNQQVKAFFPGKKSSNFFQEALNLGNQI